MFMSSLSLSRKLGGVEEELIEGHNSKSWSCINYTLLGVRGSPRVFTVYTLPGTVPVPQCCITDLMFIVRTVIVTELRNWLYEKSYTHIWRLLNV